MLSSGSGDARSYILISQLQPKVYKKYVEDATTAPLSGFTFVVVSIVHLAGGKITEGIFDCFSIISNILLKV